MKKMFLNVAVLALVITVASCNGSSQKKQAVEAESAPQEQVVEIWGTYEGVLPAADCEGIKTLLTVNADSTYNLKSEYLGVEDGVFETNGVFDVVGDDLIVLITPSTGEKTYYKMVSDGVMLSDSLGTENQGALAPHYILKKK